MTLLALMADGGISSDEPSLRASHRADPDLLSQLSDVSYACVRSRLRRIGGAGAERIARAVCAASRARRCVRWVYCAILPRPGKPPPVCVFALYGTRCPNVGKINSYQKHNSFTGSCNHLVPLSAYAVSVNPDAASTAVDTVSDAPMTLVEVEPNPSRARWFWSCQFLTLPIAGAFRESLLGGALEAELGAQNHRFAGWWTATGREPDGCSRTALSGW